MTSPGTRKRLRQIAALMSFEATTLVVMAGLHLSGSLHGATKPFDRSHAGIVEATLGHAAAR